MPLKILVTAKRVEDPESRIRVRPDGAGIVTEGVNYRMNPFDEIAVEEGLRLREKHGGEVLAVAIGGEAALAEVKAAVAMGADRGLLVRHDGPLDPGVVAELLAGLVAKERPDLVLLGKQSIDDDQNQVGQLLAERLALPQATCASKLESLESEAEKKRQPGLRLAADGQWMEVTREVDGGVENLALQLPAVVTCELRLNVPRFASLPGIMKAKKAVIPQVPSASLAAELEPRVKVLRLSEPAARKGGVKVADVEELWRRLHDEAKVL
jgi:electron transfer flavoprotein beta subunit